MGGFSLSWAIYVHESNPHKPKGELVSSRGNGGSEERTCQRKMAAGLKSRFAGPLHSCRWSGTEAGAFSTTLSSFLTVTEPRVD